MSIKLGSTAINGIYLGSTAINAAYLGSTQIFGGVASNGLLNNLISYYKCDTNSSFPDSHGSNTGTINGATYTASGLINGGYSFDGVNDDIHFSDYTIGDTLKISFWIKTTDTSATLLDKWNGTGNQREFEILITAGKIEFGVSTDGTGTNSLFIQSSNTITDDAWHHIICTFDGTSLKIYVDNVERGSGSLSGTMFNSTTPLYLGADQSGAMPYAGLLDEIYIGTGTVFTADQRTALYNSGAGLPYSSFTS